MRSHTLFSFHSTANRLAQASIALVASLVLAACGGGGTTTDNGATAANTVSNSGAKQSGLRTLPSDYSTRRAASYSPFRTVDRDAEIPTEANIKQDLELLHASGVGLIRLFDSQAKTSALILKIISENPLLDIKVHLGAYVNTFEYWGQSASEQARIQAGNNDELARCVALANSYPDIVEAVSVGNETMVSWSTVPISTRQMATYIRTVRNQIVQPVTSDDDWSFYSGGLPHHPAENQAAEVLAELDFVSMHTYAHEAAKFDLFDWRQKSVAVGPQRADAMMVAAMNKTKQDYAVVRSFMDSVGKAKLPIVIGETGWKGADSGGSTGQYRYYASPANQRRYIGDLLPWADGLRAGGSLKNVFYFEAFDEPWKGGDDKWGLFNVNRQARYAIQGMNLKNEVVTAGATYAYEPVSSTNLLYFTPPVVNTAVSANKFYVYGDSLPSDALKAVQYWTSPTPTADGIRIDAFCGAVCQAVATEVATAPLSSDGGSYWNITPKAILDGSDRNDNYGWGVLYHPTGDFAFLTENLSAYQSGTLNFLVSTTYPGKIEIGLSSDTADGVTQEAYVAFGNGQYGYCNTGAWCQVSIPLSLFQAANAYIDLSRVINRFVIADKFADTGKNPKVAAEVNNLPVIRIDAIYYSK
jgi:exo-beta-1,3-glucanase (GH17 family)